MFPLLETIRLENGRLQNLTYHEERINRSIKILFGDRFIPGINDMIQSGLEHQNGVFKCRLLYSDKKFECKIEEYNKRKIDRLIVVEKPDIEYILKYSDRSVFESLTQSIPPDSEILISRIGYLTDSSYSNIALLKDDKWFSPSEPLLEGTQRAYLLEEGIIYSDNISVKKLNQYTKIRLFNAMMPWDDCIELDISQIEKND